jgi:hypothetical protein
MLLDVSSKMTTPVHNRTGAAGSSDLTTGGMRPKIAGMENPDRPGRHMRLILKRVNRADLYRIKGVNSDGLQTCM